MSILSEKNFKKILSIGIGTYFIAVGIFKIMSLQVFMESVQNFNILPAFLLIQFSIFIVLIELIGGIALVMDVFQKIFVRMLIGTVILFTIAIIINLIRGNFIDCGCYGSLVTASISWWHVLHNATLCYLLYGILALDKKDAMLIGN